MKKDCKKTALILGGAGFVGSNLVQRFLAADYHVIVIDGLLPQTGASLSNLAESVSKIKFIDKKIEKVKELSDLIEQSDVIIDSMAWMPHLAALKNPRYDLGLNVESHLCLIEHLRSNCNKKIIYLASRSQYGNPTVQEVYEDTPMIPADVHGLHKLTSETYYRIYADVKKLNVVSLRIPNCFGENQSVKDSDSGLIGNFIKDLLLGKKIKIYGAGRLRNIVYVKDLAEMVLILANMDFSGFNAFNIGGHELLVQDLVRTLIEIVGKGNSELAELPDEIRSIEMGNTKFIDKKLRDYINDYSVTDLKTALTNTVEYFQQAS